MKAPAPVSIHTTPRPPTDADIAQHSSIRLDALRTDPDSFASTYARESKFDRAKWRERLEQDGLWTFYAKCDEVHEFAENCGDHRQRQRLPTTSKMSRTLLAGPLAHPHALGLSSYEGRTDRGNDTHIIPMSHKPWLATLTLLSPSFLTSFLTSSSIIPFSSNPVSSSMPTWPFTLLGPEIDVWLIVGLWVRPEWRRKGVGQQIVQKAVHFVITSLNHSHLDGATMVETSASDIYQSPSASSKTTLVLLEVYSRNTAAVDLYRSVGFEILHDPDQPISPETAQLQAIRSGNNNYEVQEHKTHWMGYTISPLLPHRSNL